MRTDGSFHGFFTLAPLPTAWVIDAPSAQRIATDFSHAENLSMRARFNGYAPRGQKFIAQGKRSDALGIMCCVVCAL